MNLALIERLEGACVAMSRRVAFIGVVGMLVIACVTMADVMGRWLFSYAVAGLNEITAMFFGVAIAACIPAGLAGGVNLTVDILDTRFSARTRAWCRAIGMLLLFVFFALVTWRFGPFAANLAHEGRVAVILGWPHAPFMFAIMALLGIGCVVQGIVTLGAIVRALKVPGGSERSSLAGLAVLVLMIAAFVLALYVAWDFGAVAKWAQGHALATVGIAFAIMWIFLLGLTPIAAVLGILGFAGTLMTLGTGPALSTFASEIANYLTDSQVAVLPLFLLMGSFATAAGLSEDIYRLAHAVFGSLRGGLALATIGGCAGFGAVTGSSVATAATIGRVALPEMTARGYSAGLSTGCVAAGGTLGQLVPPSTALVIYSLLTEASIGQLFVAAMGPALLAIAFYLATVSLYIRVSPTAAPPPVAMEAAELAGALKRGGGALALFAVVIGGLYFGVFTATESAAAGAVGAFLYAVLRGKLRRESFWSVMSETTATTAMIFGLIFGAVTFAYFVATTGLPATLSEWIGHAQLPNLVVIALLLLCYTLLGAIMDSFAILILTTPVVIPLITDMGYDLVWWGIIMLVVVETGQITPPFGLNIFVLKGVAPDVPLTTIFKGVLPFVMSDFIRLALLVLIPAIALWLPSTM